MKLSPRAIEAQKQREAKLRALEKGEPVRAAVKTASQAAERDAVAEVQTAFMDAALAPMIEVTRALAGFDKRAYQREYMREKYRPRIRRKRQMVAADIGWPEEEAPATPPREDQAAG